MFRLGALIVASEVLAISGFDYGVRDDISMVSLGDSPEFTSDAKRQKLVSPFSDYLNDTIPFENNYADDLNVSFSDLCISTDPQMEFEYSDLIHYMHSLIPSACKFLSQQDPIHTERFTQYLKLMSSYR